MSSHKIRTAETRGIPSRYAAIDQSLPPTSKAFRSHGDANTISVPKRASVISATSSGRRSSGSADSSSRLPPQRPSGLPRSTSSSSQARLSYIASTRPMPTFAGKSPPLQAMTLTAPVTGIPSLDTSRRLMPPESDQPYYPETMSPIDMDDDTVLGVVMPSKSTSRIPARLPPRLIPELQALAAVHNRPVNPASSSISSIGSPSTQFTTSSSPWSATTSATTPLSWSSASPNIMQGSQSTTSKRSQTVPIPANVRTRLPKLPVLKESHMSSSSSKATLVSDSDRNGRSTKKKTSPVPTPPPRSSSIKRTRSRSNSAATAKSELQPTSVPEIPAVPVLDINSGVPVFGSNDQQETYRVHVRDRSDVAQGHSRLQEAINSGSRYESPRNAPQVHAQDSTQATSAGVPKQLLEPAPIAQTGHRRLLSRSRSHKRDPSTSEAESQKQSARSRLAKFSKLAFFGRSRTPAETESQQQTVQPRKGPSAGTGHEGYSRFGRRGRKQSVSSSAAATESETSIASTTRRPQDRRRSRLSSQDQSDLDDFASSRMKPVVMVGGSQRGRTDPFPPLPKNPQHSDVSLSTMSSGSSYPAQTRYASPRRERFPTDEFAPRPTLASRRSQKLAASEESFRFPEPIDTQNLMATPCLDSRNTTQSSELPTPASDMHKLDPSLLDKQRKKSRRIKWNIFRRKDSISGAIEPPVERLYGSPEMPVNVAAISAPRSVPYYAMLGSEQEVTTTATIGRFLQEAAESPDKEDAVSMTLSDEEFEERRYVHRESVLLPSAPVRQSPAPVPVASVPQQIPRVVLPEPEALPQAGLEPGRPAPAQRQPRLAQVGRIPKVVLTRQQNEPALPAMQEPQPVKPPQLPHTIRPKPSREQLPRLNTTVRAATRPRAASASKVNTEGVDMVRPRQRLPQPIDSEFLSFSDLRNSDFTSSTDSTGIISIMAPPADTISGASVASRASRRQTYGFGVDDEVWNEYNDFMDDIMSPSQLTKLPPKIKVDKTGRSGMRQATTKETARAKGLAIVPAPLPATRQPRQFLGTPPLTLSSAPSLQEMASSEEIRLRRSRIAAALHASYASHDPSSPFSMRDFIDEYERPGSGKFSERLSGSSSHAPIVVPAAAPVSAPLQREQSQQREYENAAHLEEIERTRNPTKHSDRSYASLMVSRWLSFGRVLFSPVHTEIEQNPGKKVLVIDGLGSEDWSIYCAVTYQEQQIYVHDLKERRSAKTKPQGSRSSDNVPANHRRAEIASFNDKFPFPERFFTAIVVRFPPAMPDSKLKNIVAECRRVLCPGGYLELMVLDLDIVNMGVQTRRAIKDLKIKMSTADRNISLKPIIDNVQTVLGANGFSNLSRCVVGVPVVGKPAASLDSSSESRSSSGSMAHRRRSSAGPRPYGSLASQANFSLNDLVADHSENADAKIGRMVSRTARSWWQHCFEAGIMADGNKSKSVFASKEVLNECKTRAASFKLLIAYTQKPMPIEQRRRTMSEPSVPTLATAGGPRI
ncbi:hypothetical protein H2198_010561 [Neophaeococcomyces mojaviensis]|uniref:Uncharacterized protein n=1 Tax=Neophaeococcomyces mojaviensis TaxID=3383035 RepID=A0ACC2ZR86_9EURO|nr:hypothetical protein H2198_010561 [Knufia sp. JES_112]